jgi:hypothetical protein
VPANRETYGKFQSTGLTFLTTYQKMRGSVVQVHPSPLDFKRSPFFLQDIRARLLIFEALDFTGSKLV